MRGRTVIVLAVIAAGLGLAVLLDGGDAARRGDKRLLPGLNTERIIELTISGAGRDTLSLRRAASGFEVVEGVGKGGKSVADLAATRKLLSTLEFLEPRRELPRGRGLRQLGLAPPRLKVSLRLRGRKARLELTLGAVDPSGTGVYARAGASTPVVLDKEVFEAFDVDAQELRDRELVPFSAAQIERLVWRASTTPAVEVARGADGRWWLGGRLLAQTRAVERLAGAAAALRATRFIAPRGAERLRRTLTVSAGERSVTVRVGGGCPGRAGELRIERDKTAGIAALRGCVAASALAAFDALKRKEALRERAPLRLRPADIERVELHQGSAALKLSRSGAGWALSSRGGAKAPADSDALRRAIAALRRLQGTVEPAAAAALAARFPAATTTVITVSAGRQRRVLRFGPAEAERLPVRRDDEAAVLWLKAPLPAAARSLLAVNALSWRDRTVLQIPGYELAAVTVARRGEASQRCERRAGAWRLIAPATGAVDDKHLARLSERLSGLSVAVFLPPSSAPSGPADAVVTLLRRRRLLSGETRQERHRIELWRPGGSTGQGSCIGRLGRAVFRLDRPICSMLSGPLMQKRAR